jgi:hypothetical protein
VGCLRHQIFAENGDLRRSPTGEQLGRGLCYARTMVSVHTYRYPLLPVRSWPLARHRRLEAGGPVFLPSSAISAPPREFIGPVAFVSRRPAGGCGGVHQTAPIEKLPSDTRSP